jgi:transglutaminase-like putative cysteine protease
MLALLRNHLQIPCRYVSGYLFHSHDDTSVEGESHAWLEAYLPGQGWIGFDPTNDIRAGQRHIRVAYGRDYDDVAPTRGVYQGQAQTKLTVAVSIQKLDQIGPDDEDESWLLAQRPLKPVESASEADQINQQQQQQQ